MIKYENKPKKMRNFFVIFLVAAVLVAVCMAGGIRHLKDKAPKDESQKIEVTESKLAEYEIYFKNFKKGFLNN